ncbi:hypothetical protein CFOL_v3_22831 [Cephalotus follicularis]|uniref:Retrotransposon gag domain-containing protein n=1 Tax=Cephalotus follicularis TaxID=3775 RepID=A0A1Q3CGI2_CEPFO|nr:hypothetical protein CFOL_v3_22831 [Cephalotus follicularis]
MIEEGMAVEGADLEVWRQVCATMAQMRNLMRRRAERVERRPQRDSSLNKFLKLQPPTLLGLPDPSTEESWLLQQDKILQVLQCDDDQELVLAVYVLQGEVEHWWAMIDANWTRNGTVRSWTTFQEKFNARC